MAAALSADEYFRHQRTLLGRDAAAQVAQMHVLVVGLRGVGAETAKCLALAGIQRLTLLDDDLVREEDPETNFLLRSGDRGKHKAKVIAERLNALCPFADVRTIPGALTAELLLNYHVVIFSSSQLSREELIAYNEFCRAQQPPVGFLIAESRGLFGSIFTDFGDAHAAEIDADSATIKEFRLLPHKTQFGDKNTAVLHVREKVADTCCQVGDRVQFRDENGHSVKDRKGNLLICQVLEITSPGALKVALLPHHTVGEYREPLQDEIQVALTKAAKMRKSRYIASYRYRSYRQIVIDPGEILLPLRQTATAVSASFHVAMQSIYAFRQCYGAYPESNSVDHIQQMTNCAQKFLTTNEELKQRTNQATVNTQDVDFDLIRRLVRCVSSEFQPLSALIGAITAIQALRFCGRMGQPLPPGSTGQLQFFDILDLFPTHGHECVLPEAKHQSQQPLGKLETLFGELVSEHIQRAKVSFSQIDSLTVETLKNCLCLGIGKHSPISILTDPPPETVTINGSSFSTQPLFSPKSAAWDLRSCLEAIGDELGASFKFCDVKSASDHFEFWDLASCVISGEPTLEQQRLWLDTNARIFSRPVISAYISDQSVRVKNFVPQLTATYSESILPSSHRSRGDSLVLDHLPPPMLSTHTQMRSSMVYRADGGQFELDNIATSSLQVFEWIFRGAILDCVNFLSNHSEDIKLVWGMWTVVQRGHNVTSFPDCLQEAWRLCELLPVWIDEGGSNRVLPIDQRDEQHMALVISAGCIIAESLNVPVPSGEMQRRHFAATIESMSNFSLLLNPRTPEGILSSLRDASNGPLLFRAAQRVHPTMLSLRHSYHLQFLHSLTHILSQAASLSPPQDVVSARRLFGDDVHFAPSASLSGALVTLSLMKAITGSKQIANYSLVLPGLASDSTAFCFGFEPPTKPLVVRSITMEVTRATPVRASVDNFTLWSQIAIPLSPELQSIERIIQYLERKFRATIHEIKIFGGALLFSAAGAPKSMQFFKSSVFEASQGLLPPSHLFYSSPFVLLSATAVDDDGDVIIPPIRVARSLSQ